MKRNISTLIVLMLLLQHVSNAQYDNANKKDSSRIINAKSFYFDLKNDKKNDATVQLPFSHISFTDVRYDTSFVALNWHDPMFSVTKTLNRKYDLNGGLAPHLSRYFNNYYSTSNQPADKELVCYIKKFSITMHYELLEHFNAGTELANEIPNNDVNIEIECYYKTGDTLYPALRLDTSYIATYHFGKLLTNAVKETLQPLMYKIEHTSINNVVKRTPYTASQIAARYDDRFNIPVLTTSVYKKGVYKSFAEFKNNMPSVDSFTIATDKLKYNAGNVNLVDLTSLAHKALQKRNTTVYLYDANHELISPSSVFGYCDGATLWIQHGAFFYPLVKTGNSFEFIYSYHYADSDKRTQVLYILMPLNMETGHSN